MDEKELQEHYEEFQEQYAEFMKRTEQSFSLLESLCSLSEKADNFDEKIDILYKFDSIKLNIKIAKQIFETYFSKTCPPKTSNLLILPLYEDEDIYVNVDENIKDIFGKSEE